MPTAEEPRREHPSTYFVQDRQNQEEINRLTIQDHMMTSAMGGVLPEQANPAQFQSILDVGCETGGWLIEMAKAYPDIPRLVGVDVNGRMIISLPGDRSIRPKTIWRLSDQRPNHLPAS